jgi:hypothetical protein
LYAALKFNEIFGVQALSYPAEEFCHSPLFGMQKVNQLIIMGKDNDGRDIYKRLRHEGFSCTYANFDCGGVELLLQSTFFMQLLILKLAHKHSLRDCYFLKNKKLLKASSDLIFD